MANHPRYFAAILLFSLATSTLSSESFGPAQDYTLRHKQGFDKSLELAGFTAEEYDKFISMDDDYLDKNSEFSFLLNDNHDSEQDAVRESLIDSRACSHQCDNTCYDPLTHQCCNGLLLNGFWSCSNCGPNHHKCADRCYPKGNGFKCCFDKVIPDAWQCCPYHCNGKCLDAQKHKCCHNQVIPRSKVCCKHYCGDNCYDPTKSSCCNGQAIDKGGQCCASKCGKQCYDKAKMKCCHNKVIAISSPCCTPAQRQCGNACYSPNSHKCCHDKVIPKAHPCCTPAQRQCGNACYSPNSHKCCHDKVIPKAHPCCTPEQRQCGNACYSPNSHKCCHDKVIPKAHPCCTPEQRQCGNACYSPNSHKCCHDKVIPKAHPCCTPEQRQCGNAYYSPNSHKCCFGRVTPTHYLTCGRTCYNPSTHRCCQNKSVIPKSRPCGCTRCGGVCINTRFHRCCHHRVLLKNVPCISGSGHPLGITSGLIARRVGCFRDTWNRAIPSLESKSYILVGNYQKRPFAIEKCALAAAKRGWSVFAVQHQGWCASSPTASRTYSKYGRSNTCRNGKGGPWGNDVYVLEGKARQRTTSGDICVFPFIYKGKLYNGCTRVNHNRPWCATTPNYDVDKLGGNCSK